MTELWKASQCHLELPLLVDSSREHRRSHPNYYKENLPKVEPNAVESPERLLGPALSPLSRPEKPG